MCLYSSKRGRADDAQLAGGEHRLDQRRQVHRAAGDGAGADGRVDFVDEEDRLRPLGERGDDRLEPLFEVAAETRAGEQRAGVEREDLGALQRVLARRRRAAACASPSAMRGLADAGFADEHRVVLAPAAQHLDGALQFLGAPDQRVEQALRAPVGQVEAVGRQRIARRARCRPRRRRSASARRPPDRPVASAAGVLVMPCEMYSRMSSRVIALRGEQPRGVASSAAAAWPRRMSPTCTSSRCALCTCSTAVCSTRRNAAVCSGSRSCPRASCSIDSSR